MATVNLFMVLLLIRKLSLGGHAFYMHINLLADIQMCSDPINLKYNRAHIAFYNQSYISIQSAEVFKWITPIKAWHSPRSNQWYQVDCKLIYHTRNTTFCG